MKAQSIYILLVTGLLAGSCTSIQTRSVSDELYQTPEGTTQQMFIAGDDQVKEDTSRQLQSSRRYEMHRSPYWMYDRYPYHPYYYWDPFDFYYPYGLYPHYHAYYPLHYGWGFSYYPFASYYGYSWYGSYYRPYYPYYGSVKNYQRKTAVLPPVRSHQPSSTHTQRYRKVPQIQDNSKAAPIRKISRQQPQRKYTPYTPAKRYIRATEHLRSINTNPPNRQYLPVNRFRKPNNIKSFQPRIRQSTPIHRPQPKIRISSPSRSSSSSGRKR